MPRFRSLSTNTPPPLAASNANTHPISIPSSPTFLSRGIRSLRLHRRQSSSVPSSPARIESHLEVSLPPQYSTPLSRTQSSDCSSSPNRERTNMTENDQTKHIRLVPNVGVASRCFVFDIIEQDLPPGVVLKIGRYSDRNAAPDRLSFKSKVVSRSHAEMWLQQDTGKICIRDVGSSSGTFVNRSRLSAAGVCSSPQEIKDGDIIQLGVDYQGGVEPMYRAVRMRLEVNRERSISQPFSKAAFQQLRQHLLVTTHRGHHHVEEVEHQDTDVDGKHEYPNAVLSRKPLLEFGDDDEQPKRSLGTARSSPAVNQSDIQECCICLYAIAPFQALFIAPCSHIFHFKCLRPILFQNYPGFSCPLCRAYSDLEASVAMEVNDVLETLAQLDHDDNQNHPPIPEKERESDQVGNPEEQAKRHSSSSELGRGLTIHNSRSATATGAPELSTTLVETGPTFEQILSASSSTSH